jgi:hypothetical protein
MRTEKQILAELRRCERALKPATGHDPELYGVQQALCWVLGQNTMAPVKCALLGRPLSTPHQPAKDQT